MVDPSQLATGIVAGMTAIAFGLVPGLPQSFVEGFCKLSNALQLRLFLPARRYSIPAMEQPRGFAIFGLAIIAVTLLAYLAA